MGLTARITWKDGVQYEAGGRSFRSRYGTAPAPDGTLALTGGTGSGQANDVYETAFTLAAGATLLIDLKGGNGERSSLEPANLLAFTAVKGLELILTTPPAAGVSLLVGPQGAANAAQLWFQAASANFWEEVRDRVARFDRAVGWALDATHRVLALKNPGATSVSGWLRVIGTR